MTRKKGYLCRKAQRVMETSEIIRAIRKLPVSKRMLIVEKTLKTIRESETRKKMVNAAESLFEDYKNDKELTAFSQLDFEGFYETK
ncbi:MAG: hypothetical protein PHT92_04185 [Bacteroidales bacterium]|nr:hypothetical protein [Bacteroidales bacterium]